MLSSIFSCFQCEDGPKSFSLPFITGSWKFSVSHSASIGEVPSVCPALCWADQQTRQTEGAFVVLTVPLGRQTINRELLNWLVNYSCDEDCEVRKLRGDEKKPLLASWAQGSHPRGIGFLS